MVYEFCVLIDLKWILVAGDPKHAQISCPLHIFWASHMRNLSKANTNMIFTVIHTKADKNNSQSSCNSP